MDPTRLLAESRGFFTRAEALELGGKDQDLVAGVRGGTLVRFRRGYYTFPDLWTPLSDQQRHLVRCRAVVHAMNGRVVLTHVSAALAHGIATWGVELSRVHVSRLDAGAGRIERDVVHHEGRCRESDLTTVDGLPVVSADRAAIEVASMGTAESALVALDSYLQVGLGTHDDLFRCFDHMQHWPRMRHLHFPVRMADGRSASPGESRGRWLFRQAGLPAPELQFAVYDREGVLRGTTDWAWPGHHLLGEFDGLVKYGRLVPPGREAGEVVFAEKSREDQLRELTGFGMIRLVWSDFERPRLTSDRMRRALDRAA